MRWFLKRKSESILSVALALVLPAILTKTKLASSQTQNATHLPPTSETSNQFECNLTEVECAMMLLRAIGSSVDRLNERLRGQRELLEEVSCAATGNGTSRGCYCLRDDNNDEGGIELWDRRLSHNLESLLAHQRVGDFGAGLGWYGRYFLREVRSIFHHGQEMERRQFLDMTDLVEYLNRTPQSIASYDGYDCAGGIERVTGGFVRHLDLAEEQHLSLKFDWVMSLEVGEHIPPTYERIFLDNLVRHACKGVLLSWAAEGQKGYRHVNNRNNDHVKEMMLKRGFASEDDWNRKLRSDVYLPWFKYNLMVFRRLQPLRHRQCR